MKHRYIELDLLRTLAIALMVIYHLAYDLEFYYGWRLGVFENTGWYVLRQGTASLFLLIVGTSFAISWDRHRKNVSGDRACPESSRGGVSADIRRYKKYLLRGLGVITCGMLVTAATYVIEPETYVRFGILHLIGVGILLLPFFVWMKEWNAIIGLGFGLGLGLGTANTILLIPIGIPPPDFATVDYFPLIPWFGIILMGYAIGHFGYVRGKFSPFSIFVLSLTKDPFSTQVAWPGRYALLIYLLHQPIILGLLGLVRKATFL